MIQKYQTLLIIAAIVAAFLILGISTCQITNNLVKLKTKQVCDTDTVWITKFITQELTIEPTTQDGVVTPKTIKSVLNKLPGTKIDTFINWKDTCFRELPILTYRDSIRMDSSYVIINDTVVGWRKGAKAEFHLKYPIVKSIVDKPVNKFRLYTYMRFGSDFKTTPYLSNVAPGAGFVTKRGFVVGYDYNFIGKSHNVTIGKVISFKK